MENPEKKQRGLKDVNSGRTKTHQLKKRPPHKPLRRQNDIYITNKSNIKAQLKQCEDILNSGVSEVYIHCLGHSISRGINLALILTNKSNGALCYEANTSTIQLIDELHPLSDKDELLLNQRMNSALHIKVYRTTPLPVDL